eukprot:jgi/Bigna1/134829/aug1.27_g9537
MSFKEIARQFASRHKSLRERAVAIHDYVREIPFGFTWKFDGADADFTLKRRVGHCTPKSELFSQLLRSAGFPDARVVGVKIPNNVLHGYGAFPDTLHHTFVEVTVEGRSCRVDSFIVDPELFNAAKLRLEREGREFGYGIHAQGTCDWDGQSDAFSQYFDSKRMARSEEKRFESTADLLNEPMYEHKGLSTLRSIPLLGWAVGSLLLESKNSVINQLRQEGISEESKKEQPQKGRSAGAC